MYFLTAFFCLIINVLLIEKRSINIERAQTLRIYSVSRSSFRCFANRKIASAHGLTFSSFDDSIFPAFSRQNKVQMQSNRKNKAISISKRSHHLSLSLSLSPLHWSKRTSTIVMVVFFFSHIVHKDSFTVFIIFFIVLGFAAFFRHTSSDTFYLMSFSLSLAFFLSHSLSHFFKHTCTYHYNVPLALIDYNNCIYIYKSFFFHLDTHTRTHTHTHSSISTLKTYRIYHRHLS